MQTFLPYPDFAKSASVLDNRRLGKQRVECLQILNTLKIGLYQRLSHTPGIWLPASESQYKIWAQLKSKSVRKTPWYNHPAVKMWRGYEIALAAYGMAICREWCKRGFDDNCFAAIARTWRDIYELPPWLGNSEFHASHRSNLLRKDFDYYSQFGWIEPTTLEYVWPVK